MLNKTRCLISIKMLYIFTSDIVPAGKRVGMRRQSKSVSFVSDGAFKPGGAVNRESFPARQPLNGTTCSLLVPSSWRGEKEDENIHTHQTMVLSRLRKWSGQQLLWQPKYITVLKSTTCSRQPQATLTAGLVIRHLHNIDMITIVAKQWLYKLLHSLSLTNSFICCVNLVAFVWNLFV